MSFGNNLKLIRKEKGITQEQLAEMLNVSRQAVSKWESDSGYPETDKLLLLAGKLNVSLDFLMDNKPKDESEQEEKTAVFQGENTILIATYDKSQTVRCLSVRYSKIVCPAKNEPAYILQAVDRIGFFGAHSVILGWYEDEEAVRKEVDGILSAMNEGQQTYSLQYFADVRITAWGTAARK